MAETAHEASARTAVARAGPSAPVRWLEAHDWLEGHILDYGSGRGADTTWLRRKGYTCDAYDPNWEDDAPRVGHGGYDTVLCVYVVNVLPPGHQADILDLVRRSLTSDGVGIVVVRSDVESDGWTSSGTYQRDFGHLPARCPPPPATHCQARRMAGLPGRAVAGCEHRHSPLN